MSRGRGERNWDDPLPHTEVEPPQESARLSRSRKKYFFLSVECIEQHPHQFIVTDEDNNEWLVLEGADGQLTIEERPEVSDVASDKMVLSTIKKRWPI